ncbi:MAG: tetratricopeptide repeat protein [Candidatus Hodarchaeota archaeon]
MTKRIFLFLMMNFSIIFPQTDLEKEVEYLRKYIGSWPPRTTNKDSLRYFEKRLMSYIEKIKNQTYSIQDSSDYYFRLGEAYHFGHNINMDNSYNLAYKYLNKAYNLNPKSIEIRMALGAFYGSTNPENAFKAFPLFYSIIQDDPEGKYPNARYNLALLSTLVGEEYLGRMAALEYKKLMPEDTKTSTFLIKITHRIYNTYIKKDTVDNVIHYENTYSGFSVKYPIELKIYADIVYCNRGQMSQLNLKTPKTATASGDSITNAVAVNATPSELSKFDDILDMSINIMVEGKIIGKRNVNLSIPNKYKSIYFEAARPYGEKYKGIYTSVEGKEFNYVLGYVATTSTYEKNLKYFEDFEKSFKIIKIKKRK